MKIFFSYGIENRDFLGNVHIYDCEEFTERSDGFVISYINDLGPDAIISKNLPFLWRLSKLNLKTGIKEAITLVYLHNNNDSYDWGDDKSGPIHILPCEELRLGEIRALQYLEELNMRSLKVPRISSPNRNREVALIGAGAVNLMTALMLLRQGYQVKVYAADPEPYNEKRWLEYGCTFAGSDARIFSFNESRNHHYVGDPLANVINDQYQKSISNNGWLACPSESLGPRDREWIKEYESYPQWLFEKIQNEIIGLNKESYEYWKELIEELPLIFKDTGYNDRLFRIYSSNAAFEKGKKTEQVIGAYLRELSNDELKETFPCFQEPLEAGDISGALEVEGFGINVHKFALNMISYLESKGVEFYWNENIQEIIYDSRGLVKALQGQDRLITADYYVVSPGVPTNEILKGTSSNGQIGAMIGCWITLPNLEPQLKYPLKVARTGYASQEAAAGANVIPGKNLQGDDVLHISSGHGFLGLNPKNIYSEYVENLSLTVHGTAKSLFPRNYESALADGLMDQPMRYCIRPWTPSCLGVFEMIPTVNDGMLIITGGHNTGGFAHSASVAQAVVSAFKGMSHPMHRIYHPNRLRSFFKQNKNIDKEHLIMV